jgi:hypothetical protein
LSFLRRSGESHAAADSEVESNRAGRGISADIACGHWWLSGAKEADAKFSNHAAAVHTMNTPPKIIYLFLSSEKDFAAFCRILTNMRKPTKPIDSIGDTVFSMVS